MQLVCLGRVHDSINETSKLLVEELVMHGVLVRRMTCQVARDGP